MSQAAMAEAGKRKREPADAFAWRQRRPLAGTASHSPAKGALGNFVLRLAMALGLGGLAAGGLLFAQPLGRFVWAGQPLRVEQVSSKLSSDGRALIVEGGLVNRSNRTISMPLLRLAIRTADQMEIFAWTVRPDQAQLAPGARTRFTSRLAAPPTGGIDVAVTLPVASE